MAKAQYLIFRGGELDDQVHIVGLNLCFVGGLVSDRLATFFTAVNYDITLFGIGHRTYGAQDSAALVGSVTRIYINVER